MINQLKSRYVGNTLLLTLTHKVGGVATAITDDIILSSSAHTTKGEFPLEVAVNPDQVANAGKFTVGAIMVGWGTGIVSIDIKKVVNGATPIPSINQIIENTPPVQFTLKKGIS